MHSAQKLVQIFFLDGLSLEILLIVSFSIVLFGRFVVGLEEINAIKRTTHDHFEVDRMELNFLDFLLTLMQEHELIGNVRILFLIFNRHVPNGKSIIFTSNCNHRLLIRLKCDRCYWFCMPIKTKQLFTIIFFTHS